MQTKQERNLQKLQLETVAILDRIISILDELPTIVSQEEALAVEPNLNTQPEAIAEALLAIAARFQKNSSA